MTESTFSFQSTPLTIFVSLVVMVLVCVLAFYAWKRSGYRRSVLLLELLRVAVVGLAVFLLNQPETVTQFVPSDKPTVVVLGDASQSMATKDVGLESSSDELLRTRSKAIETLLDDATWEGVADDIDVVVESFAEGDEGDRTNLHDAIRNAQKEHPNLRALLLASDGDWNDGLPPVEMATRLRLQQIPIFTVPVGSPNRLPDIDLLSFDVPTFGVIGKTVRIPFTVESSLPRDYSAVVTMKTSDGQAVTHDVRIAAMGRTTDAILWQPEQIGDYTLTLSIPSHPQERVVDNNERSTEIKIREEKLKVLIVETLPRWEYRYLRNALSRDPGVEVSCLLFHPGLSKVGGGNKDYIKSFPEALEDLQTYDVVFLGGCWHRSGPTDDRTMPPAEGVGRTAGQRVGVHAGLAREHAFVVGNSVGGFDAGCAR